METNSEAREAAEVRSVAIGRASALASTFLQTRGRRRSSKAIAPEPGDVFLEIGPGKGALTFPLAASGAPVLAVEIDRDLVRDLASRLPRNVTVVSADVLKTDVVPYLSGLEPQRAA